MSLMKVSEEPSQSGCVKLWNAWGPIPGTVPVWDARGLYTADRPPGQCHPPSFCSESFAFNPRPPRLRPLSHFMLSDVSANPHSNQVQSEPLKNPPVESARGLSEYCSPQLDKHKSSRALSMGVKIRRK